jgi:hypothetical protein
VFVTGAYRKQMEEMETYREQEATADRIEGIHRVSLSAFCNRSVFFLQDYSK